MDDLTGLRLAAIAAAKAQPEQTFENPRVGAVIVKADQVLAVGWHERFGGAHAEMNAFHHLGAARDAQGATLYVTLEPCAVRGKVAACAETIRDWGLARVVIGDLDPNPATHGLGVQKLRAAGISVVVLDTDDSRQLNPAFYQYHEQHQPYIQLKLAQSHNGYVSAVRGQRSKITDAVADLDVHRQRARHSAIIVGSETWRIDQPRLTVRDVVLTHRQPQRVVIDRRGRLAHEPAARLKDWLVYTENARFAQQENVVLMSAGLPGIIADLGRKGMQSVMVEGGPTLMRSFLQAQLWHECLIYTADSLLANGVSGIVLPQLPDDIQRIGHTQRQRYINQEVATCLQASRKPLVV